MQLSRLPSAPQTSQLSFRDPVPGEPGQRAWAKAIPVSGHLLPKSGNRLEASLALPHPALAVPWDLPGLCDIPALGQDGPG